MIDKERKPINMITKRKYSDKWIIAIKAYSDNSIDSYLDIVLCYLPTNKLTPYVTWIYNHSDKGFHSGHYHERINDAIPEFLTRGSKAVCFNDNWITKHDAVECHYVNLIEHIESIVSNDWEECCAKDAQMVSVYLHKPEGGIKCVSDHLNGLDAMRFVRYLSNKYEMPIRYQPEGVHYVKLKPIN